MIYVAYFIFFFTLLLFIIALLNFVFRVDYSSYKALPDIPVSVIIPARNEAANIAHILDDVCAQNYTNIEIIVVDDDSSDATAEIVMSKAGADTRISLIRAGEKKNDWLGKNHACYQGALHATGKYFLFLDADVRIGKKAISSTLGYLEKSKVVFLSIFPKQIMHNAGVYKVVPIMNYILLSLLPLFLVRKTKYQSLGAANGQFILFDAEVYREFEPHRIFRREKVEDIHIARFLKKFHYSIACLTGNEDISCHMYDTYKEAMNGFSKNITAFFGNSYLVATIFWLIHLTGIFWVATLLPTWYLIAYIAIIIFTRVFTSLTSKQDVFINLLLHYLQMVNMGLLIMSSLQKKIFKNYEWKGRTIT